MVNNWPVVKFGSLYKEPSRNGLTKPKKVRGEGLKFINMGEIFKFDRMDNIPCERAPLNDKEKATSLLEVGDLLFARQSLVLSGAGKCSIFLGDEEEVAFESHLIRVRLDSEKVNPEYVYYYFKSPQGRANINTIVEQGAGQAGIRGSDLEKLDFPVPPRELQDYIVECITPCDLKLEINQETNQTLEQMAQALFKSWFVDFDPVFDNALASGMAVNDYPEALQKKAEQRLQVQQQMANREPSADKKAEAKPLPEAASANEYWRQLFPSEFEQTHVPSIGINGWIPKGWKKSLVSDMAEKVFSGGTPNTRTPEYWGGDFPWFSSGETKHNLVLSAEKLITKEGIENSSTKLSRPGDILIASAGQGHTRGQTALNMIDTYFNQSVVCIRPKKITFSQWLFENLYSRYEEMRGISDSHSIRGSLTTKLIAGMPVVTPSEEIIDKFEQLVSSFRDKRVVILKQNSKLESLRNTLLPKLISGELQLSSESIDAEASS